MFFKRRHLAQVLTPPVVIEHHLTESESQRLSTDIPHYGAVLDINKNNYKEDTLMVEKLKAYLEELKVTKENVANESIIEKVEADVVAFRETATQKYELEKETKINKIDSDIECITRIIELEEAKAAAVTETEATAE